MKYNFHILLLTVLVFMSCTSKKSNDALVEINEIGVEITQRDVDRQIARMQSSQRKKFNSELGQKNLLHEITRYNIFDAEAKKVGLKDNKGFQLFHESGIRYKIGSYYKRLLQENLFYDEDSLRMFYTNNISEFKTNDSTYSTFEESKQLVLRRYILANEDLNFLYEKNKDRYSVKGKITIKHIFDKEDNLSKALDELKKGVSFDTIVKKYSKDAATLNDGGVLGSYYKGQHFFGINDSLSSLYTTISTMEPKTFSNVLTSEKGYHIFYLNAKRDPQVRSYQDVKVSLVSDYIKIIQDSIKQSYPKMLKKKYVKYHFDFDSLDTATLENFYNVNRNVFEEQEVKIKVISSKSSEFINKKYTELKRGISFDSLYNKKENPIIFSLDMVLPSAIQYREVAREIKLLKNINDISETFRTDWGYHIIQVVEKGSIKLPVFDKNNSELISLYYKQYAESNRSKSMLEVGSYKITFEDYILSAKNKVKNDKEYNRAFSINSLNKFTEKEETGICYYLDAVENGLLDDEKLQSLKKYWDISFWAYIYEENCIGKYNGYDKDVINKFLEKSDYIPSNDAVKKVILKELVSDSSIKKVYYANIEKFIGRDGRLMDFSAVKETIKSSYGNTIVRTHKIEYYKELFEKYKVVFSDDELIPLILLDDKAIESKLTVAQADSLWNVAEGYLEKNKVKPAMEVYQELKQTKKYYEDASVKLARLYEGEKQYSKSLEIYNELLTTDLKKKDEVLFLKGFLFYDFLKRPDMGKPFFKELVKEFPKSELADDASFLIKGELPKFTN